MQLLPSSGRVSLSAQRAEFPEHPYRLLERRVRDALTDGGTVLDIGCGREAERLHMLCVTRGIGVDVDAFMPSALSDPRLTLLPVRPDGGWDIPDASVDVAYSVSVVEHLADPPAVFREAARVLRPSGRLFILTPNLWDYASLAARVIPNRWHGAVVKATEGRDEADTFPTFYRANTKRSLTRALTGAGLDVDGVVHLNSAPSYLAFHQAAWRLGVAYHRALDRIPGGDALKGWLFATTTRRRQCGDG